MKDKKNASPKKTKAITPLKDFIIHQNEVHIELKKGEEIEIPTRFIDNLKTEKIIGG